MPAKAATAEDRTYAHNEAPMVVTPTDVLLRHTSYRTACTTRSVLLMDDAA